MSSFAPPSDDPNFDIDANQRGRIVGSMVSIYIITIAAVALRFLSRKLSKAGFWWDDWLCLAALLTSLMVPSMCLYGLRSGYGRHIYIFAPDDQIDNVAHWLEGFWVNEIFFHTSTTISKLAILAFYYRVFQDPRFHRLLYWIAGVCLLYMIGVDLAVIFQCNPVRYAWDRVRPDAEGTCMDEDAFFIASGSINVGLNFLVFIIPIPLLRRLRTTAKQRIVLTAIFTLAGFVVIVSMVWVIVISRIKKMDVTWNYIDTGIWSALEPTMAVVCACIPSLRPLFSVIGQRFSHAPLIRGRDSNSTGGASWSKRLRESAGRPTDSNFSKLDELDDLRPLGHDVSVRGGRADLGEEEAAMELPQEGIKVKTEVSLVTSDRIDYNDRLF